MAKPSFVRVSESHAACASVARAAVTVRFGNGGPEWIEIPVPALVTEATFALAQEQFEKNKRFSPRRTLEPSLLQGLLVCQRCGYGLYRASTRTSQRTIYYYRC
jgi:hypothetical protein